MISRWYYLLSLIAGASLTLAFAPFELFPVSWISLAVFFFVLSKAQTTKQHLSLSYLFGLGMFGTGASWFFHSIYFYAYAPLALAIVMTSAFVMFIALLPLVFGLITGIIRKRIPHQPNWILWLILFPSAWVLTEWLRSWILTGFPWLLIGHSQIDTWLANFAPVAGELSVSWASALLSGALLTLLLSNTIKARITSVALIVVVGLTGFLLGSIEWTQPKDKPIKVALLQGNIPQQEKWLPENLLPTIRLYKKLTDESWDSDLIIWPETALPSYFVNHMEDLILPLHKQVLEKGTDLILGGFHHVPGSKPDTENAILVLNQDERAIYGKQHLVPFSEYVPLLDYLNWLRSWIQLPFDSVKKGTGPTVLNAAGQPVRLSICYEDAYGTEMINGLPEASLLINISNDGWFTGSIEPYQHMEIARMRALETGRYLIRSTNIGVSGIVNTKGKITATAPTYETTIIKGEAIPYSGSTPFIIWGNFLIISFLFIQLILLWPLNKLLDKN